MIPVGHTGKDLQKSVDRFLKITDQEANLPVLVHCSRGKERAGLFSAVYRMEYDRWSNQEALIEMYNLGLDPGSMPVVEEYIWHYRPRWKTEEVAADEKKRTPEWQE